MLHTILIAGALVAITVAIHAVGLGIVLSRWARLHPLCADALLAHHLVADPPGLVSNPDPFGRDFGLGIVLSLAGMPARCRVGVLFRRSHLHDHWLWRSGAERAMANARPGRGIDRHPHVRFVRRHFLRSGKPGSTCRMRTENENERYENTPQGNPSQPAALAAGLRACGA